MLLWQGSIVEIDYGLFRVVGPYLMGKSLGPFKILIFGLWSFIWPMLVPKQMNLLYKQPISKTIDLLPSLNDFRFNTILKCYYMVIRTTFCNSYEVLPARIRATTHYHAAVIGGQLLVGQIGAACRLVGGSLCGGGSTRRRQVNNCGCRALHVYKVEDVKSPRKAWGRKNIHLFGSLVFIWELSASWWEYLKLCLTTNSRRFTVLLVQDVDSCG